MKIISRSMIKCFLILRYNESHKTLDPLTALWPYRALTHTSLAGWQSGYAEDCKSLYVGSIPVPASMNMTQPTYILIQTHADLKSAAAVHDPKHTFLYLPHRATHFMGMGAIWGFLDLLQRDYPEWVGRFLVDCGDAPGYVLSALRHGAKLCTFSGPPETLQKLQSVAKRYDAQVMRYNTPSPPWHVRRD